MDVENRRLDLLVDESEIKNRLAAAPPTEVRRSRGYGWLFEQHIMQADKGCDFDFLTKSGVAAKLAP
jgi:dihydroxy-acid dehydratase